MLQYPKRYHKRLSLHNCYYGDSIIDILDKNPSQVFPKHTHPSSNVQSRHEIWRLVKLINNSAFCTKLNPIFELNV